MDHKFGQKVQKEGNEECIVASYGRMSLRESETKNMPVDSVVFTKSKLYIGKLYVKREMKRERKNRYTYSGYLHMYVGN